MTIKKKRLKNPIFYYLSITMTKTTMFKTVNFSSNYAAQITLILHLVHIICFSAHAMSVFFLKCKII